MTFELSKSVNIKQYILDVAEIIHFINSNMMEFAPNVPANKIGSPSLITHKHKSEIQKIPLEENVGVLRKEITGILKVQSGKFKLFIFAYFILPRLFENQRIIENEIDALIEEIIRDLYDKLRKEDYSGQWYTLPCNKILWDIEEQHPILKPERVQKLIHLSMQLIEEIAKQQATPVATLLYEKSYQLAFAYYHEKGSLKQFIEQEDSQGNTPLHYFMVRFHYEEKNSVKALETLLGTYHCTLLKENSHHESPFTLFLKRLFYKREPSINEKASKITDYLFETHKENLREILRTPIDEGYTILGYFVEKIPAFPISRFKNEIDYQVEMSVQTTILDIVFRKERAQIATVLAMGFSMTPDFICRMICNTTSETHINDLLTILSLADKQGILDAEENKNKILDAALLNVDAGIFSLLTTFRKFHATIKNNAGKIIESVISQYQQLLFAITEQSIKIENAEQVPTIINLYTNFFIKLIQQLLPSLNEGWVLQKSIENICGPLFRAIILHIPPKRVKELLEKVNICQTLSNMLSSPLYLKDKKLRWIDFIDSLCDANILFPFMPDHKDFSIIFPHFSNRQKLLLWSAFYFTSTAPNKPQTEHLTNNIAFIEKHMVSHYELAFNAMIKVSDFQNTDFSLPARYFFSWLRPQIISLKKQEKEKFCNTSIRWVNEFILKNDLEIMPLTDIMKSLIECFGIKTIFTCIYQPSNTHHQNSRWHALLDSPEYFSQAIKDQCDPGSLLAHAKRLHKNQLLENFTAVFKAHYNNAGAKEVIDYLFTRINHAKYFTQIIQSVKENPSFVLAYVYRFPIYDFEKFEVSHLVFLANIPNITLTPSYAYQVFIKLITSEPKNLPVMEGLFSQFCIEKQPLINALVKLYLNPLPEFFILPIICAHPQKNLILQHLDSASQHVLILILSEFRLPQHEDLFKNASCGFLVNAYAIAKDKALEQIASYFFNLLLSNEVSRIFPILLEQEEKFRPEIITVFAYTNQKALSKLHQTQKDAIFPIVSTSSDIEIIQKLISVEFSPILSSHLESWVARFNAHESLLILSALNKSARETFIPLWIDKHYFENKHLISTLAFSLISQIIQISEGKISWSDITLKNDNLKDSPDLAKIFSVFYYDISFITHLTDETLLFLFIQNFLEKPEIAFNALKYIYARNLNLTSTQKSMAAQIAISFNDISMTLIYSNNPFSDIPLSTPDEKYVFLSCANTLSANVLSTLLPPKNVVFILCDYLNKIETKPLLSPAFSKWLIDFALAYLYADILNRPKDNLSDFETLAIQALEHRCHQFYRPDLNSHKFVTKVSVAKLFQAWNRLIRLRFHYLPDNSTPEFFVIPLGVFDSSDHVIDILKPLKAALAFSEEIQNDSLFQEALYDIALFGSIPEIFIMSAIHHVNQDSIESYYPISDIDLVVIVSPEVNFEQLITIFTPLVKKYFGESSFTQGCNQYGKLFLSIKCAGIDINLTQSLAPSILAIQTRLSLLKERWGKLNLLPNQKISTILKDLESNRISSLVLEECYKSLLQSKNIQASLGTWTHLFKVIVRFVVLYSCQTELGPVAHIALSADTRATQRAFFLLKNKYSASSSISPHLSSAFLTELDTAEKSLTTLVQACRTL